MPWTYAQRNGALYAPDGERVAFGYSGFASGRNMPSLQGVPDVGPIPTGRYTIGAPHDTESHGPYVLPLTPNPTNNMHGRSGFLVHGDSVRSPGKASHGCIIMARAIREAMSNSTDKALAVVADYQSIDMKGFTT